MQESAEDARSLKLGTHWEEVKFAAFSADGRRCVTVQEAGIARIWEVETGEQVGEIRPDSHLVGSPFGGFDRFRVYIEAVALSPNGEFALLGLNDGTAGVFAVADGVRLSTLYDPARHPARHCETIRSVAYSPDGTLVLVGFYERTVGVWRADDGVEVTILRHPCASRTYSRSGTKDLTLVSSVAVSRDNRYLFAGDTEMTASLWELATGKLLTFASDHVETIIEFFWKEDRLRWATSAGNVWEAAGDAPPMRLLQSGETWMEVAFSPDGERLLAHTIQEGKEKIEEWALNRQDTLPAEEREGVRTEAARLPWGGREENLPYYPPKAGRMALSIPGEIAYWPCEALMAYAVRSPQGSWRANLGWGDQVELRSVASGETVAFSPHYSWIHRFAFSSDGALLAIAGTLHGSYSGPCPIHLLKLPEMEPIAALHGHDQGVIQVAFGPGNRWLVSIGMDRIVRLWNLEDGSYQQIRQHLVRDLNFNRLHVLSDGRILIFRIGETEVWNSEFQQLVLIPGACRACRISDDEQYLLRADALQRVSIWSLTTGECVRSCEAPMVRPELWPAIEDGSIQPISFGYLWRFPGGPYLHISNGPRGWMTPLTLSGNGAETVVQYASCVAHLLLEPSVELVRTMPFSGRMRAGCIVEGKILTVNAAGELSVSLSE